MSIRAKILLTILLAVVWSYLFGCTNPTWVSISEHSDQLTTLDFLQSLYPVYNEEYFQNRLPNVPIDLNEKKEMATTVCEPGGVNCAIHFNLGYTKAPRVAEETLLHEMCHISKWEGDDRHGPKWRACMLHLDSQGAFREIIIDNYREEM